MSLDRLLKSDASPPGMRWACDPRPLVAGLGRRARHLGAVSAALRGLRRFRVPSVSLGARRPSSPSGGDCCPRCGEPGPRPLVGQRCSHCMGVELAYTGARSAFLHAGVAKRMVVEFKSGGQPVLAPLMARLAAPAFRELVAAAAHGARGGADGGHLGAHASGGPARAGLQPGGTAGPGPGALRAGAPGRGADAQAGADPASEGSGEGGPAGKPARRLQSWTKRPCMRCPFVRPLSSSWTMSITTGATTQEVSQVLAAGTGAAGVRVHVLAGGVGRWRGARLTEGLHRGGYNDSM